MAHGADANAHDNAGHTVLDTAAGSMPLMTLQLLLDHGAQPHRSNALHSAVRCRRPGGLERAACLIDYGAPINALEYEWSPHFFQMHINQTPSSALHIAVLQADEEMVELLLQRGADPHMKNAAGLPSIQMVGRRERIADILQKNIQVL